MQLTFPRSWFDSETDYIKANKVFGNSPNRQWSDILDSDGNPHFTKETSNIGKLILGVSGKNIPFNGPVEINGDKLSFTAWDQVFANNNTITRAYNLTFAGNGQNKMQFMHVLKYAHFKKVSGLGFALCFKCASLETLIIDDMTSFYDLGSQNCFTGLLSLKRVIMNNLTTYENLAQSTLLTREALVEFMKSIGSPATTQNLVLGSDNLAKLTDEDKKIATDKGWTLS